MKFLSLFSGIGGFEQAAFKLGWELAAFAEIDKFAIQSYRAIYGEEHLNLGDVSKIPNFLLPPHDVLVGGFPCQAFSVAGERAGMTFECPECFFRTTLDFTRYANRDFSCTLCGHDMEAVDGRGLLFFEVARVAKFMQPKAIVLENVKGLVGHDKGRTLDTIVTTLSSIGYVVDFEILNSKFYGVPQNRERVFIVAIREDLKSPEPWAEESLKGSTVIPKGKRRLKEYEGVKTFNFPYPENDTVTTILRDILESEVDERFYLDDDKTAGLIAELNKHREKVNTGNDQKTASLCTGENLAATIDANYSKGMGPSDICNNRARRSHVLESESLLTVLEDGSVKVKEATKKGYAIAQVGDSVNIAHPKSKTRRGRVGEQIANTLMAGGIEQAVVEALPMSCEIDVKGNLGGSYEPGGRVYGVDGVSPTISASDFKGPKLVYEEEVPQSPIMVGMLDMKGNDAIRRVYDSGGCDPTLTTMGGGNTEPKIVEQESRIRKLTPRECWRLQAFPDSAFDKAQAAGVSNSQLYKQAGNAVTVTAVHTLLERLDNLLKSL